MNYIAVVEDSAQDRAVLDSYLEKYQQEKAELEGMKQEQEAEQANLQAAIDERRASSADCDNEIAYAQQMANEYAALIEQQQAFRSMMDYSTDVAYGLEPVTPATQEE